MPGKVAPKEGEVFYLRDGKSLSDQSNRLRLGRNEQKDLHVMDVVGTPLGFKLYDPFERERRTTIITRAGVQGVPLASWEGTAFDPETHVITLRDGTRIEPLQNNEMQQEIGRRGSVER